jgi:hypothetical protein
MRQIFLAASSAFACIPGLGAILTGFGAPPNAGAWFGGVATTMGVFTIILIMLNSERLSAHSMQAITKVSILLLIAGIILCAIYTLLFDWCIVNHLAYGSVVYPLWTSGDLAQMVDRAGGRWNALDRYGAYGVDAAIRRSSSSVWALTVATFIVCYSAMIVSLTAALALPAARLDKSSASRKRGLPSSGRKVRKKKTRETAE